MDEQMTVYICINLFAVLVSGGSQIMLKYSANRSYSTLLKEYLNPYVLIAYVLFALSTLLSIYSYKVIPLSMGPVLEATGYIYVILSAKILFDEKIDRKKVIATAFIIGGIIIYATN